MNTKSMKFNLAILCTTMTLMLGGCGGGSSATTPPAPPPPTGGIEGSGIAVGTISGFGSIIVNGVRFDTSSATITVEGQPATQASLAVGQVVRVSGSFDNNGTTGTADAVRYDDILEGPIASINLAASTLTVLGQTVVVDAETSFGIGISPASLEGLSAGNIVEVSGFIDSDGTIRATRIELDNDGDDFEVEGVVQNHDGTAMTFTINALTVDYSAATLLGFPAGAPENGQFVEVEGSAIGGSGELLATQLEFEDRGLGGDDGDDVELEGFITRFNSAQDFDVSGIPVTTNAATVFEGGSAADLGLNIKVEVEGSLNASGVLVADKVDIRRGNAVRVTANADSVNAAGNSLVLLGITVNVDALTRLEDKSSADVQNLSLANLNAGDYLEIRGAEFPAGSGTVLAALLEREDPDTEAEIQGFVETVADPSFTILGVTVDTNAGTVFRDVDDSVISATDFFARLGQGSLVAAEGTEVADTRIAATEVEFEN